MKKITQVHLIFLSPASQVELAVVAFVTRLPVWLPDMKNSNENAIHVTGFGVFRNFTVSNPSWEAVKQLTDHIVHNGQTIPIVKHEVPVTYEAVDKKIHEIWSKKPRVSALISMCFPRIYFAIHFSAGSSLWCRQSCRQNMLGAECIQRKIQASRFYESISE